MLVIIIIIIILLLLSALPPMLDMDMWLINGDRLCMPVVLELLVNVGLPV